MDRTSREGHVFGSILLLANKLQSWGDGLFDELTLKQWFLLLMISKIKIQNPTIKEIADFTRTSRQNTKKMLEQLEKKGFVHINQSEVDARALNVSLSKNIRFLFHEPAFSTAMPKLTRPARRAGLVVLNSVDGIKRGCSRYCAFRQHHHHHHTAGGPCRSVRGVGFRSRWHPPGPSRFSAAAKSHSASVHKQIQGDAYRLI